MTGFLTDWDGARWQLPPLLAWELTQTDGEPCGSFWLRFAAEAGAAETLRKAVRFSAAQDGAAVFTGVVDETELTLDTGGLTAEVTGRDLAAVLLDNQTRAAEFASVQLRDILNRYVTPLGITQVDADALPQVDGFSVATGESCWRVLEGFCRHAAGVRPRFLADGTLCLRRQAAGRLLGLGPLSGALALGLRRRRYGVISGQTMVDLTRKTAQTTKNPSFLAQKGQCERVSTRSGWTLPAGWRTAQQRIDESQRDCAVLTARLPGGFLAEPGDRVRVDEGRLGLAGQFRVAAATTRLDAAGLRTELTLQEER